MARPVKSQPPDSARFVVLHDKVGSTLTGGEFHKGDEYAPDFDKELDFQRLIDIGAIKIAEKDDLERFDAQAKDKTEVVTATQAGSPAPPAVTTGNPGGIEGALLPEGEHPQAGGVNL